MIEPRAVDITGFFTRDHRRIDALLEDFRRTPEPERALPRLEAFAALLLRHIGWEERALFPAFEEKLGEEARARVDSMKLQHGELGRELAELRRAVAEGGAARRNAEEVLLESLGDHNHAEELFIYPWMDGVLTAEERGRLVARLEQNC